MTRATRLLVLALCGGLLWTGCRWGKEYHFLHDDGQLRYYKDVATEIEYPDAESGNAELIAAMMPPRTLRNEQPPEYWPVSLREAAQIALANSTVMRDLGGRVINAPQTVRSVYDPAIQESDPLYGVEGALSAFDASFSTSVFWEKNDRSLNNEILGGGTRIFRQDKGTFQSQIAKQTASGGLFAIRNNTGYDANNSPSNLFPSAWDTNFEVEARQPFLQGAGVDFNRIAGPGGPGYHTPTGVVLARINTDIALADFEEGVRTLVSDVENAYWDLYFAYRDLDAKIAARDRALDTWRAVNALFVPGTAGGEADREARAREQYFLLQAQVEDALAGSPRRGTQTGVGASGGGAFQGLGGVYSSERRLRLLMGLPIDEARLVRPADEPTTARVVFDWYEVLPEATVRRVELRRQKWQLQRAELELLAARNYLLPRLDGVAQYRWRGFGDHLWRADSEGRDRFDNAMMDLTDGDFQEWQLGLLLDVPIGFRQAHAAVRNAELRVARERAVLSDQELQVAHDLGEAVAELERAYTAIQTTFNRRLAADQHLKLMENKYFNPPDPANPTPIEFLHDAQRRRADADIAYYRALVEYSLAIKNVHFEKGSLLDYNEVYLAEGPWPAKAAIDARKRAHERSAGHELDYGCTLPREFSRGPYWQDALPGSMPEEIPPAGEDIPPPLPE